MGNRKSVNAWKDSWIPWLLGFKLRPIDEVERDNLTIKNLMLTLEKKLEEPKLQELFDENLVNLILKIPIPNN